LQGFHQALFGVLAFIKGKNKSFDEDEKSVRPQNNSVQERFAWPSIRVDEGKGRRIGAILRDRVFTDSITVGRLSPEMGEGSDERENESKSILRLQNDLLASTCQIGAYMKIKQTGLAVYRKGRGGAESRKRVEEQKEQQYRKTETLRQSKQEANPRHYMRAEQKQPTGRMRSRI